MSGPVTEGVPALHNELPEPVTEVAGRGNDETQKQASTNEKQSTSEQPSTNTRPISLVGTSGKNDSLPHMPTNVPTNETKPVGGHESTSEQPSTIDKSKENRQIKRGWIEWTARETKQYGKRRYPRSREWLWDTAKEEWVKSNPVYRPDLDTMNEEDYVKFAKRRDKAKKLGY